MWLSEIEVDDMVKRFANDPVLGPVARYLSDYRDIINRNSDGWHVWSGGSQAGSALMQILQDAKERTWQGYHLREGHGAPTQSDIKKAIVPIKAFFTRWSGGAYGNHTGKTFTPPVLMTNVEWEARNFKEQVVRLLKFAKALGMEIGEDNDGQLLIYVGFKSVGVGSDCLDIVPMPKWLPWAERVEV
jgi:hypothetical protein